MECFDSGAPESNHKGNAKDPGNHTQKRAELLEIQTAWRCTENLWLDWACSRLLVEDVVVKKTPTVSILNGACFNYHIGLEEATFKWRSKSIYETYPKRYTKWLIRHVFGQLPIGSQVRGCSEHKRNGSYLFRAHPAYRSHKQWHGWALFDWSDVDDEVKDTPTQ